MIHIYLAWIHAKEETIKWAILLYSPSRSQAFIENITSGPRKRCLYVFLKFHIMNKMFSYRIYGIASLKFFS